MRICVRCKASKPESEFNASKPRTCKACWRETQRAYADRVKQRQKAAPATKTCGRCKVEKPSSEFGLANARPDGLRQFCKFCVSTANRQHLYGLTEEAFAVLVERQGGLCAICSEALPVKPHVDHDHACCSGQKTCGSCVRGLLCQGCNHGLGNFKDDPVRLRAAIDYLT